MDKDAKTYVAGHKGMVGSAIVRLLEKQGFKNLLYKPSDELNLINQSQVDAFFKEQKPEYVFLAAAKVGGIHANNTYRGQFLYENLQITSNVIHASFENKVKKLLFLGSSCIYPKFADNPIKETSLLTGPLEPSNEPYAIAKIAGVKLCETYHDQYGVNFISAMPTNLYGPNDNYDLENSHVLPALIRKFYSAKVNNLSHVEIWGSGKPLREFLHVDDLAKACLFLMENYNDGNQTINVGFGEDVSIKDLALLIKEIVGFEGDLVFDTSKLHGTPRKLLDGSKILDLGWKPKITLRDGIEEVYASLDTSLWK